MKTSPKNQNQNNTNQASFQKFRRIKPDKCIYPTLPHEKDVIQGEFLSGVLQIWIQCFPSPRLVAIPRLKSPVCSTIHP